MDHSYNSGAASKAYQSFLNSVDGQIFRNILGKSFMDRMPVNAGHKQPVRVLDAGCGDGWLAGLMAAQSPDIHACDAGEPLIEIAQQKYPAVQFTVCDLNKPLPYEASYFDIVTASMVLHDVEDELATLQNIAAVLKPEGKLLASIVNPYYGYPIGEWKRGLWGRLLRKKPALRLARFYNQMMGQSRPSFEWRPGLGSHFTPLSAHIHAASQARLTLTDMHDISADKDSPHYNLTYQLYRFPIILLLEFTKQ